MVLFLLYSSCWYFCNNLPLIVVVNIEDNISRDDPDNLDSNNISLHELPEDSDIQSVKQEERCVIPR